MSIQIAVDPTNPGQFFACCGLLELADRLWPGAEGWFESIDQFMLQTAGHETTIGPLCQQIVDCELVPLIPDGELTELNRLNQIKADFKRRKKAFPRSEENV